MGEQTQREQLLNYYQRWSELIGNTEPGLHSAILELIGLLQGPLSMEEIHKQVIDLELAEWPAAQEVGSYARQRSDVFCQYLRIINGGELIPSEHN